MTFEIFDGVPDEIRAYNWLLNYQELNQFITRINNCKNTHTLKGTEIIPFLYSEKEKTFLSHLPVNNIRKFHQITSKPVKT